MSGCHSIFKPVVFALSLLLIPAGHGVEVGAGGPGVTVDEQIDVSGKSPRRVSVPSTFGSSDIRDWYAPDNRTLIINTYGHGRFKATFAHPCTGIRFTDSIGFATLGPFQLDSSTNIVLPDGQRCSFQDLMEYTDEEEQRDKAARTKEKAGSSVR